MTSLISRAHIEDQALQAAHAAQAGGQPENPYPLTHEAHDAWATAFEAHCVALAMESAVAA